MFATTAGIVGAATAIGKGVYVGGKWIYKGIDKLHRGPREKERAHAEMNFLWRNFTNQMGTAIRRGEQQIAHKHPDTVPGQYQLGLEKDLSFEAARIWATDNKVLVGAGIVLVLLLRR